MDEKTHELANRIREEQNHDALMALFAELDRHLFESACAKPYLDEPDPGPWCSFFKEGTCGYVNGINELFEKYGINLPNKSR